MKRTHAARSLGFTLVVAFLLAGVSANAARPFRRGAIATAHPAASEAALAMLNQGGNATDAAVAAAFVLSVVAPYHSGIGGGGFALVYDAQKKAVDLAEFREVAPAAATRDMFVRDGAAVPELSSDGPLAVAVPGAARGYLELLAKHGKLKPSVVMAPAIRYARKGFWVTPKFQNNARHRAECLRADPEAARLFLRPGPDGVPAAPELGTVLMQPELARTLQSMAKRGAKAFYEGPVAKAIEATLQERGGVMTTGDLANYKVRWRTPLETTYRGHRIVTMPPPSAGGIILTQVLGVLERRGAEGLSSRDPEVLHTYVEALRRAYVDRARYLGDPAFSEVPVERLTSGTYVAQMLSSIDPKRATPSVSLLGAPPSASATPASSRADAADTVDAEKKNTTHISIVDAQGNAVALTATVNYGFGSCVVAKGTGVLLNDEMDDFSAMPMTPNVFGLVTGEANAIAPGKIPLSSMTPTLVFSPTDRDRVMLVAGSPGGGTIPTTVIQVISHVIDGGMDVVRASAIGRIHHQYLPDYIRIDRYALEPSTVRALEAKGHRLERESFWGDAELVYVDPVTGLRTASADPRNEGLAIGQD